VKLYQLTVNDVAEILSVSSQLVTNEIARGNLTAVKVGGRTLRISEEDLKDYLARSLVTPRLQYSEGFQADVDQQQLVAEPAGLLFSERGQS
jgi:excisionase family DNA binding protein